jgi:hypothetical protein
MKSQTMFAYLFVPHDSLYLILSPHPIYYLFLKVISGLGVKITLKFLFQTYMNGETFTLGRNFALDKFYHLYHWQ